MRRDRPAMYTDLIARSATKFTPTHELSVAHARHGATKQLQEGDAHSMTQYWNVTLSD